MRFLIICLLLIFSGPVFSDTFELKCNDNINYWINLESNTMIETISGESFRYNITLKKSDYIEAELVDSFGGINTVRIFVKQKKIYHTYKDGNYKKERVYTCR